jgi:aldose 1-epimerase
VTIDDTSDGSLDVRLDCDVGTLEIHRDAGRRNLTGCRTSRILVQVDERDRCAFGNKFFDNGAADPAGAAGHKGDFSSQSSHSGDGVILYGSVTWRPLVLLLLLAATTACSAPDPAEKAVGTAGVVQSAGVTHAPFGPLPDGTSMDIFTLTNASGMEVRTIPYGAIIVSIRVPDRNGRFDDVVLGFDRVAGYLKSHPYFGAVVGRYGNRIARGQFTLDGKTYKLATNNGPNHLHGGVEGFDKKIWRAEQFEREGGVGVIYTLTSPDGDQGYPGGLIVRVTYTLRNNDELSVDYEATTDRPTPINLTQHTYFNLRGEGSGDILGHRLTIDADRFTPVDQTLIPTGMLAPVAGTPFDFLRPAAIGARIDADDQQLKNATGYDHNWVLNRVGAGLAHAARLEDPKSGRSLDISTTEPGIQFYAGNFLDGTITGKAGHVYRHRAGLCLETQHFPDSPNHSNFPTTILRPEDRFQSKTVFAFGVTR